LAGDKFILISKGHFFPFQNRNHKSNRRP